MSLEIFIAIMTEINCMNENNPSINTAFDLENINNIIPIIAINKFNIFPRFNAFCSIDKSILSP
ncbi:hypothetical protein SFBM_0515 [Candidatus Arthromitus sp. SFB-mouse-Japan]|nr:hypothetical protein SFBM_0515 [Candidatus Arthromitus sp. SFB-mouse-Japan]